MNKGFIPFAIAIAGATSFYFLYHTEPIAGVVFFLYGIPLAIAGFVVFGIISALAKNIKILSWYCYGMAVVACTVFLMPAASNLLDSLPTRTLETYRITLDVDTPQGLKRASEVFAIKSNQFKLINKTMGRESIDGAPITLVLDNDKQIQIDIVDRWETRNFVREIYGYKNHRDGNTKAPREIPDKLRPKLIATNQGGTREIKPAQFESFFGPGYYFRRMWIKVLKNRYHTN